MALEFKEPNILIVMKKKLLIITIFIFTSCNIRVDFGKDESKKKYISGIVIRKFQDYDNHGSPCIELKNGSIIDIIPWNDDFLWAYIEIGDSIYKPSGTLKLKLIKPTGETREFNYFSE